MNFKNVAFAFFMLSSLVFAKRGSIKDVGGYLLVMQWPYSVCTKEQSQNGGTCFIPYFMEGQEVLTVHGFWPEYANFSGGPQCCTDVKYDKNAMTPELTLAMNILWPTFVTRNTNDKFHSHELIKHGSCSAYTGTTQNEYFAGTLDLARPFHQASAFFGNKVAYEHVYTVAELEDILKNVHGKQIGLKCSRSDANGHPGVRLVQEFHLCYDKMGDWFDCPAATVNHLRRGCGADFDQAKVVIPNPWRYD